LQGQIQTLEQNLAHQTEQYEQGQQEIASLQGQITGLEQEKKSLSEDLAASQTRSLL
jgi:peptidoglycan hydrolase CwlO-like protein